MKNVLGNYNEFAVTLLRGAPGLKLLSCELHFASSLFTILFGMDVPHRRDNTQANTTLQFTKTR